MATVWYARVSSGQGVRRWSADLTEPARRDWDRWPLRRLRAGSRLCHDEVCQARLSSLVGGFHAAEPLDRDLHRFRRTDAVHFPTERGGADVDAAHDDAEGQSFFADTHGIGPPFGQLVIPQADDGGC